MRPHDAKRVREELRGALAFVVGGRLPEWMMGPTAWRLFWAEWGAAARRRKNLCRWDVAACLRRAMRQVEARHE